LPILFVSRCGSTPRLAAQFASVEPLGSFETPTGPDHGAHLFWLQARGLALPDAAARWMLMR